MIALNTVLVATDFSEPSDAALRYGRALARTFHGTLHLVHVVGNLSTVVYGAEAYSVAMPELQREIEDDARKKLVELLVDDDERPLSTRHAVLTSDAPAAAIVDYAM